MKERTVTGEEWTKLCAAVGLIENVTVGDIVQVIDGRRRAVIKAKETLASYCPEADAGRLSLRGVVDLLVSDVLSKRSDS